MNIRFEIFSSTQVINFQTYKRLFITLVKLCFKFVAIDSKVEAPFVKNYYYY